MIARAFQTAFVLHHYLEYVISSVVVGIMGFL